jgi:polyisoprenyl-teichoic acid--peptidoglycan teichoic acid transferase
MIKSRKKKKIMFIICIIAFAGLSFAIYVNAEMSKIKKVEIPKSNQDLSISDDSSALDPDIVNIALFGVNDTSKSKGNADPDASDSIMILSVDNKQNKIKLISILRDTYVYSDETNFTKINYTFSYGGAALAVKTLNSTFKLNIKDYAIVNFDGFKDVIDSLGGVSVEIKDYEVPIMSKVGISSSGTHTLNGKQALAYCRIRKVGYADFERTERQRVVLEKVFEKIKSAGIAKYPSYADKLLPYIETNMNKMDIISLGTRIVSSNAGSMEQARFPAEGYWNGITIDNRWYCVPAQPATNEQIHNFIYNDILASKK